MDIEKTMEFILAVQARLEASAQKHDERIAKHDEHIAKHDEHIAKHDEHIAKLESSVATLTDLVGRLAESTRVGFQELRELHANTESKLNALIDTVDKLVRRNGRKK